MGLAKGSYCNNELMWQQCGRRDSGSMMIMRMMTGIRAVKMIGVA